MADFKTHITVSTALGIGYGCWGYFQGGLSFESCAVAAGLCSAAGMLPDLDSGSSVPHREMISLISLMAPMLMLSRFAAYDLTPDQVMFAAGFLYLFIRFVVGAAFRKYTVHRGMWHSIPAAMIAGLVTFLLCHSFDFNVRLLKAWAVVLGFVSHLILDEIYAVNWAGRRIGLKSSFGTAVKMLSASRAANLSTYGKLILLIVLVCGDQYAVERFRERPLVKTATDYFNSWWQKDSNEPTVLR
jgi:membrane-bound metal-dependent hydrolase YbcI (DUF457 family)